MRISLLVEGSDAARLIEAGADVGYERIWVTVPGAAPTEVPDGVTLVVAVDPTDDSQVSAGEVLVSGESWRNSLSAVLADRLRGWVRAENVGTVAAAGRAGVGVVLPEVGEPEEADELTDEYFGELESMSAKAIGGEPNAAAAVFLDAGDDADHLVGLIERFRQAGVDEVALRGDSALDAAFIGPVIVEFDDPEVLADARKKADRLAPAIERLGGAPPAPASEPAKPPKPKSERSQAFQERAVRRMSDGQIEALLGNRVSIRFFFGQMARMFVPSEAGGFVGPIEFALGTPHGDEVWTIECSSSGAKARKGASPDAKLHVEAKLADFVRVGAGEMSAPSAVLSGKLNVRGDFGLALRLGPMFGGKPIG